MKLTLSEIQRLQKTGKIRGFIVGQSNIKPEDRIVLPRKEAPQVTWMHWNIWYFCEVHNLKFKKEYQFAKAEKKKFRFDFAIPSIKFACEYDGLVSDKSGHTSFKGYTQDTEKMKLANQYGFTVYRYTFMNYKTVVKDLETFYNKIL